LAPLVGKRIARSGGNALLLTSGFVIGLGLMILAVAPTLIVFVLGWCVIGVGMAAGLYDALFATLGKHYGTNAKGAIVQVTLVAGLCTTITWPLLGLLIEQWGWRHACLGYGVLLWLCVWPLTKLALPAEVVNDQPAAPAPTARETASAGSVNSILYWLVAVNVTIGAIIMTMISVQLIGVLQAQGISLAAAISLGTVIGPCQIGVHLFDAIGPKKHPIWSALVSAIMTVGGIVTLLVRPAWAIVGVILYGCGNGMRSILRGTLPLVLFDPATYPVVLGRLALPALVAQAITPIVGDYVLQMYGSLAILYMLLGLSLVNLLVTFAIKWRINVRLYLPERIMRVGRAHTSVRRT